MKRLLSSAGLNAGLPLSLMALLAGCAIPPPPAYYPKYFENNPPVVSTPTHYQWVHHLTARPVEAQAAGSAEKQN
jgi:hypothetical protein